MLVKLGFLQVLGQDHRKKQKLALSFIEQEAFLACEALKAMCLEVCSMSLGCVSVAWKAFCVAHKQDLPSSRYTHLRSNNRLEISSPTFASTTTVHPQTAESGFSVRVPLATPLHFTTTSFLFSFSLPTSKFHSCGFGTGPAQAWWVSRLAIRNKLSLFKHMWELEAS